MPNRVRTITNSGSSSTGTFGPKDLYGAYSAVRANINHPSTKPIAWKLQGSLAGVAWQDLNYAATTSTGAQALSSTVAGRFSQVRVVVTGNDTTGDVVTTWAVAGGDGTNRANGLTVHKFGRNPEVGNNTWEDVWTRGGVYAWPTAAQTVHIVSNSADDAAAGTGARSVTIEGLDANLREVSETIATNGTSTSTGTQVFFRVNRAYVAAAGEYGTLTAGGNKGTIDINTSTGGAVAEIRISTGSGTVGLGQTEVGRYTVPARKVAYIASMHISVDASKPARVVMFQRRDAGTVAAPFTSPRIILDFDAVQGAEDLLPVEPIGPFPAGTDLWFAAKGDGNATEVSVDFEVETIDG